MGVRKLSNQSWPAIEFIPVFELIILQQDSTSRSVPDLSKSQRKI